MNEHLILDASPRAPALVVQVGAWSIGSSWHRTLLALMHLKGLSFVDTDRLSPSGVSTSTHWAVAIKGSIQCAEALKPIPPAGCVESLLAAQLGWAEQRRQPGLWAGAVASLCESPHLLCTGGSRRQSSALGSATIQLGDLRQASNLSEDLSSLLCRGSWGG